MTALTKAEMADRLNEVTGLNRRDAKLVVELLFDQISDALINGEQVKLSGFGNFELRDKRQRPGRNPKTGEEIPITARRVVTFRAGQKFRQMVEDEQEQQGMEPIPKPVRRAGPGRPPAMPNRIPRTPPARSSLTRLASKKHAES